MKSSSIHHHTIDINKTIRSFRGEPDTSICIREPIIEYNPNRLHGQPSFPDGRVFANSLFVELASGGTIDTFLDYFPYINKNQAIKIFRWRAEQLIKESCDV